MAIDLFSPVGANFIKDWVAQNINNCEIIDADAGPCLVGQALTAYTPQLSTNTGTNPVLGVGGFIRGYYYRIWDQVYSWGEFRFGSSGTSLGSGSYLVSTPLPADVSIVGFATTPGFGSLIGDGLLWDQSTDSGKRPLVVQLRTANLIEFARPVGDTGSELVNSGSPVTWTNQDGVSWAISYKRLP